MKIIKANTTQRKESIKIAKKLKEGFTKEAIDNMKIDFKINKLVVAVENSQVLGFLCYSSFNGFLQLKWMGVRKNSQFKGVGKSLLKFAEKDAKNLGLKKLEADTLTDKNSYKPYVLTRNFYYHNGFKKIGNIKIRG